MLTFSQKNFAGNLLEIGAPMAFVKMALERAPIETNYEGVPYYSSDIMWQFIDSWKNLGGFVMSYLEAIEFTDCGADDECRDKILPDDLGDGEFAAIWDECERFVPLAQATIASFTGIAGVDVTQEQIAHDFWLTRNGHGAGFWDRSYGIEKNKELGQALSDLVGWRTQFSNVDALLGDDGKVYLS